MDCEDKLIADNMGLVYKQLHHFHMINDDDALSFAMEALWNAARTYKGSAAFSTYATVCIYNALGGYVRRLNKKNQLSTISYNNTVEDDKTFELFLGATETPEDTLIKAETYGVVLETFNDLYLALDNPTARQIIDYWHTSGFNAKQTEIAGALNVTQSYVSRVLSAFRHKLKKKLEEYLC